MTVEQETAITSILHADEILGLTMFAEAAGDGREGGSSVEERLAVGSVVRNRVRRKGIQPGAMNDAWNVGIKAACLARFQFSCWNHGTDANHVRLIDEAQRLSQGLPCRDLVLAETIYLARGILSGMILDRTANATHYFAPAAMIPAGSKPFWVYLDGHAGAEHDPVATIGSQVFYRDV